MCDVVRSFIAKNKNTFFCPSLQEPFIFNNSAQPILHKLQVPPLPPNLSELLGSYVEESSILYGIISKASWELNSLSAGD